MFSLTSSKVNKSFTSAVYICCLFGFKVPDITYYLENNDYSFAEWCSILKIVYNRIGPHKELMEFLIKEV